MLLVGSYYIIFFIGFYIIIIIILFYLSLYSTLVPVGVLKVLYK